MIFNFKLGLCVIALMGLAFAADLPTDFPTPSTRPTVVDPDVLPVLNSTTAKPATTTVAPATSTVAPVTTTVAPKTTTVAPKTTTAAPVTTTAAPVTTTVAPVTTTVAPVTTTKAPVTTTKAPVPTTTSAPPTPPPFPTQGKWEFSDGNDTCIIVQFAAQLNLTYNTTDNKTANIVYNIPSNDTKVIDGNCNDKDAKQHIQLEWGTKNDLLLLFEQKSHNEQYGLAEIVLNINVSQFPNGKSEILQLYHVNNTFSTPLHMSYHCGKLQTVSLVNDEKSNKTVAWLRVKNVQLEAFHKSKNGQFSTAKDCDAIDTPDIVPIAVGCALTALVAVVLIAYLVGRRRAQARGYVSM